MKKLLIFDSYYSSLYGAQKSAISLTRLLNSQKNFAVTFGTTRKGVLKDSLTQLGIATEIFNTPKFLLSSTKNIGKTMLILKAMFLPIFWILTPYNLIRLQKYDYICVNDTRTMFLFLPTLFLFKGKVLWYVRIRSTNRYFNLLGSMLADKVICISSSVLKDLTDYGINKSKLSLVKTGFNKFDINNVNDWNQEKLRFVSVGSICSRKNQIEVFELFKKISDSTSVDCVLSFIGDAEEGHEYYYSELKRSVEIDHIHKDKVFFLGKIEDVYNELVNSDVFLFSSSCEGLPRSIIEAVQCGVFIVSKEVDGTDDILINEGIGIQYNSIDEVKHVEILFSDSNKLSNFLSRKAKIGRNEYINKNFSNDKFIKDFTESI